MQDNFISGYTKGILDVQRFFENHSEHLQAERLYTKKGVQACLKALVKNREEMRETGAITNLAVRKNNKGVEVFKSTKLRNSVK